MSSTLDPYERNRRSIRRTNTYIIILFMIFTIALGAWFITTTNTTFNCQRKALNNMAHDLHLAIAGDKNKIDYREGPQTC